jgi:hypothetical protein
MPRRKAKKGRRSRFKKARHAQEQLEQVEQAQKAARKRKLPLKIDSIEKSEQRLRNSLKQIRNADDAFAEFE